MKHFPPTLLLAALAFALLCFAPDAWAQECEACMLNPTVTVSFNTTTHELTFNPPQVDVYQYVAGQWTLNVITWVQEAGAGWTFVEICTSGPNAPTQKNVHPTFLQIFDNNTQSVNSPATYSYTITILYNGKHYSTDPQIVNKGGTGP